MFRLIVLICAGVYCANADSYGAPNNNNNNGPSGYGAPNNNAGTGYGASNNAATGYGTSKNAVTGYGASNSATGANPGANAGATRGSGAAPTGVSGRSFGHGHKASGTACLVKGSYCSCHYCKCEKGNVWCDGGKGGKHGHGHGRITKPIC